MKIAVISLVILTSAIGARADWTDWAESTPYSGWFTNGTKGEVVEVTKQSPTEYSVEFAGYWDDNDPPGDKENAWWGWEGNHEWDRYPEPWGQKTYSFNMVGQDVGYGREAVVFQFNQFAGYDPTEIIWHFRIPTSVVSEVRLTGIYLRRVEAHVRPNDGAPAWTPVYIPPHELGEYFIDEPIPLDQLDSATPGELTFQLRYSAWGGWNSGNANGTQAITAAADPNSCAEVNLYGFGLSADLDENCQVDLGDFGILASQWFDCSDPHDPCCIHLWEE